MTTLQNFIYPNNPNFGSKEKYVRVEGSAYFQGDILNILKYSSVRFDTYYNAFSVPLWQQRVGIENVALEIAGQGSVEIELWHMPKVRDNLKEYDENPIVNYKETVQLQLTEEPQSLFELNILDTFEFNGLLFPVITALDEVEIHTLRWTTSDMPRRDVKLGISITHFNRKAYVIPAMRRIKENILDDPDWQGKIDFIVVDNSRNITTEEAMGVTIVPNENTGGSGGFTRGLLHYKNDTDATHVLFMDDDASLEVESIKRAYRILQYAEKENSAVGAALFYEDRPDVFIERGARLDTRQVWWAKFRDAMALSAQQVLRTETDKEPTEYAGWWFCAFPIKDAEKLTPPYFVRGDDVSFSVMNQFNLIFANGIACIAEDFEYKVAPMTEYLNMRNKLIVHTLFINKPIFAARYFLSISRVFLLAVRHGYVAVLHQALKDYLNITAAWMIENADMQALMPKIKELAKGNIPEEIDLDKEEIFYSDHTEEKRSAVIARWFTLNKMLLPLHDDKVVYQDFTMAPKYRQIAGFRRILYVNPENKKGFVVTVKRGKVIRDTFQIAMDSLRLLVSYRGVRRRLMKEMDQLTSEKMWLDILDLNKK